MKRTIAALLASLALAASASTAAYAKHDHQRGNSMNAPGHLKKTMCGPGHHWVKAYRRRNATWVQGYCR